MLAGDPAGPILLFDGQCRLCRTFAVLASWWGRSRGLRVLPLQREKARRLLPGWTDVQVASAAHLILPEGQIRSGSRAFVALLDRLPAVGPVHRRMGGRFPLEGLVRMAYGVAVTVRGAADCANPRHGAAA